MAPQGVAGTVPPTRAQRQKRQTVVSFLLHLDPREQDGAPQRYSYAMHGTGAPLGELTSRPPDEAFVAAARVAAVLRHAERVLVVGHAGADGDVCGSSLALATALRELGKTVVVYNEEPYPEAYAWLAGGDGVETSLSQDAQFDATVVVDAARPDRLGVDFPDAARRGTYVWMDHHKIDVPPGDVNFIDLTAAAVGEMVAMVLDALDQPVSAAVAECLYASLLADTGSFRYQNTSARALRLAAKLIESGVDPWTMTERIYESQPEARLRLLGRALSRLELTHEGRLGTVQLLQHDFSELNAGEQHLPSLINHVRSIKGVEVAALLVERQDATKLVLRSRGNVDVAAVARALGGAGHKNAASLVLPHAVAAVRQHLHDAVLAAMP